MRLITYPLYTVHQQKTILYGIRALFENVINAHLVICTVAYSGDLKFFF